MAPRRASKIMVSAVSPTETKRAQDEIAAILRDRHHITSEDDFSIRNLSEMAAAQQRGTRALTGLSVTARIVAVRLGWPFSPRLDMVVVAFGFSTMVGIVFGLYPARKASVLNPIDALRYE